MVEQEQRPDHTAVSNQDTDYKVRKFLKAVPHLEFSDKGLQNIATRFNVSIKHLKQLISNEERTGNT
jgi:AraC-like DNA-binding protein